MTFTTSFALALVIVGVIAITVHFFRGAFHFGHEALDRWSDNKAVSITSGAFAVLSFAIGLFASWIILKAFGYVLMFGLPAALWSL